MPCRYADWWASPASGQTLRTFTDQCCECAALKASPFWVDEGIAFKVPSRCLGQDVATRLWRPGATNPDSRHRFAVRNQVILNTVAAGYTLEGPVFCILR